MFNERLMDLRKSKGIDQKECAKRLGLQVASKYNKWEKGANRPNYETLCQLANFFDVTTDYLLGVTEDKRQPIDELKVERDRLVREIEEMSTAIRDAHNILIKAGIPRSNK